MISTRGQLHKLQGQPELTQAILPLSQCPTATKLAAQALQRFVLHMSCCTCKQWSSLVPDRTLSLLSLKP